MTSLSREMLCKDCAEVWCAQQVTQLPLKATDQEPSKTQISILLLEAFEVKNAQDSILTLRQLVKCFLQDQHT